MEILLHNAAFLSSLVLLSVVLGLQSGYPLSVVSNLSWFFLRSAYCYLPTSFALRSALCFPQVCNIKLSLHNLAYMSRLMQGLAPCVEVSEQWAAGSRQQFQLQKDSRQRAAAAFRTL